VAVAAAVVLVAGVALALLWAPEDADQGPSQRIFYLHVPIALTAYACFGWGAWKALRLLWTGDQRYDLESYTAVHMGTIFGTLTLVTGSIWARTSWGVWWSWGERQLVLFLILFLFYAAYFMLRFSLPEGPGRARISAVYALFGVVLIPISFLAIRLGEPDPPGRIHAGRAADVGRHVLHVLRLPRRHAPARRHDVFERACRKAPRSAPPRPEGVT